MLYTIAKPNDIIECKYRIILVFLHSQGNVSKITPKLQPHGIICCYKTVVCPENFSVLPKCSSNCKLEIQESILIKLLKPTFNKNVS